MKANILISYRFFHPRSLSFIGESDTSQYTQKKKILLPNFEGRDGQLRSGVGVKSGVDVFFVGVGAELE